VREVKETLTLDPVQPEAAGDPSYDEAGRFRETAVIVRIFDPLDRLTLLVDPAGGVWRARYDSQSNRTLVSDATGTVIDAATDVELAPILDLLTPLQRENANDHGNRRRYIYDNTGRMVEAQHELRREGVGGGPIDVENPFDRDGIITERFEWDDAGRLAAWTNDAGNVTRLDRDLAGKVTRKLFPDGTFQLHERDRDGHLQGLVAEDGTRHEQTFDALGRVVERSVTRAAGVEGTARQRFEYDGLGRVTAAFDGNDPANPADDAAVLRRYDSFGNLLEECQGDLVVGSAYDADSRRIGLTYPDGLAVQTPRDAAGRLAGLADPTRVHATYRWFGSGRLLEARIAPSFVRSSLRADQGGILRDVAHDAAGEELEVIYRDAAGEILHGFEYGRDRSGHQLYEAPFHGLEGQGDAWRYDSVYRVKTYLPDLFDPRVPPIDPLEKLVFYPDGNHSWRFIEVNFSIRRLEVNARSAYIESNDDVFTYDARGNLTTAGRLRFTYDALGRLVKVTRNTTTVIALYRYDASGAEDPEDFIGKGRRVAKEVVTPAQDQPAGVLRFAYDGERLIEERDGAGTLLRQYLHDESGPTALLVHGPIPQFGGPPIPQSPRPHTLLRNGAGSITGIADPTGAFIETAIYELHGTLDLANRFGNPVNFSGVGNAVLFGGHYYDYETGFHLHGARHFDPQLGRRLADASPPSPARPLELNGYLRPPLPGATGEVLGLPSRRRSAPELAPFQVDLRPRGQVPWTVPRVPVIDPLEELHAR
jgi:YD repeat-containing protein